MDPNFDKILVDLLNHEREYSIKLKEIKEIKNSNTKTHNEIVSLNEKILEINSVSSELVKEYLQV